MIALNDGVDIESGIKVCEGVGHFKDMTSFDQVMAAWDKIIREFTRQCVIIDNCCDTVLEKDTADILCSALCDDCIERGLNLKEGGAVYDFISDLQVGIANQGDSLAAIKKCVFEDHAMTPAQLWDALMNNFAGEEGEHIRKLLIAAPKYGKGERAHTRAAGSYRKKIIRTHGKPSEKNHRSRGNAGRAERVFL